MSQATIADAHREFQTFIEAMNNAYWEASTIASKDVLYDVLYSFHLEMGELNKLSIQDYHFPYEIIMAEVRDALPKLRSLADHLNLHVARTRTAKELEGCLTTVLAIVNG